MDVYGRVARALMEYAQQDSEGVLVIEGKVSRQDVAKSIGASREMVSRVIKDLEERGYIHTTEDGKTIIRDRLGRL
jgi:CRP-like cAMP-binding protein